MPDTELEGDVFMGESSAAPLSRRQGEAVQVGGLSKPVEFDGIKTGIVETLPDSQKLAWKNNSLNSCLTEAGGDGVPVGDRGPEDAEAEEG